MKKSTITVLSGIAGALLGATGSGVVMKKQIDEKTKKVDKFKNYYNLLNQWLILKQEGKNLAEYFKSNGYNSIAIYGMGELGERLCAELKDTGIEIKYGIDKNADSVYSEVDVYEIDDELEKVDAIIVTAIFVFDDIEEKLSDIVDYPVISLEDVVYEI